MGLLDRVLSRGKIAASIHEASGSKETESVVDGRLTEFVSMLQPRVQAKLDEALSSLPDEYRSVILDVARPAMTQHRPKRPRSLWRAVCFAAESCIVDNDLDAGHHMAIPRSMLSRFKSEVVDGIPEWKRFTRMYDDAEDAEERLEVLGAAQLLCGNFLGVSGTKAARSKPGRWFAKLVEAAPNSVAFMRDALGIERTAIERMPFVAEIDRDTCQMSMRSAAVAAAKLPSGGADSRSLTLIQCASAVRPSAKLILMAPFDDRMHPERVVNSDLGTFLEWNLWHIEGMASKLASRGPVDPGGREDQVAARFQAECKALADTIGIERSVNVYRRLVQARRAAQKGLPPGAVHPVAANDLNALKAARA